MVLEIGLLKEEVIIWNGKGGNIFNLEKFFLVEEVQNLVLIYKFGSELMVFGWFIMIALMLFNLHESHK